MKNFTTIASMFILSAMSISTHAAPLGNATIIEPAGKYASSVYNITLRWDEDVEMINPETDESGKKYFNATINASGHVSTAKFTFKTTYDYETWDEIEVKNEVTAYVYSNLTNSETYETLWGDVKVTLPEGVVQNADGSKNQSQEFDFVLIPSSYSYNLSPEDYSTVNFNALKETALTFEGTVTLVDGAPAIKTSYYKDDQEVVTQLPVDKITIDGNSLILDLSQLVIGYNSIIVPEGFVFITDSEGKKSINSQIMFSYTVWNGMSKGDVLYPTGYNVTSLTEPIKVTWGCPVTLSETILPKISCYAASLNTEVPAQDVSISDNVLYIDLSSFADQIPSGSNIDITIPEGMVTGDEGANPVQTLNFYYYEPYGQDADFKLEGKTILITWPGINVISSSYLERLFIVNPDDSTTELTWSEYGSSGDAKIPGYGEPFEGERIEVDLSGIEFGSGEYTLVVPAGVLLFFMPDYVTYSNARAEYKFNPEKEGLTSGISNPMDTEGILKVYNLQGVNILNTTDVNAIKSLDNGIYIINGKKILIRK